MRKGRDVGERGMKEWKAGGGGWLGEGGDEFLCSMGNDEYVN